MCVGSLFGHWIVSWGENEILWGVSCGPAIPSWFSMHQMPLTNVLLDWQTRVHAICWMRWGRIFNYFWNKENKSIENTHKFSSDWEWRPLQFRHYLNKKYIQRKETQDVFKIKAYRAQQGSPLMQPLVFSIHVWECVLCFRVHSLRWLYRRSLLDRQSTYLWPWIRASLPNWAERNA